MCLLELYIYVYFTVGAALTVIFYRGLGGFGLEAIL